MARPSRKNALLRKEQAFPRLDCREHIDMGSSSRYFNCSYVFFADILSVFTSR